jgi:hypothetical protein
MIIECINSQLHGVIRWEQHPTHDAKSLYAIVCLRNERAKEKKKKKKKINIFIFYSQVNKNNIPSYVIASVPPLRNSVQPDIVDESPPLATMSSIITKVYLLSDTATAWSVTLTESTVVREVLAHIGKKLSIGADKLELYACYVVPERPESETQDKMDPDSTLWDVKTELQLPREAKFRWGLRVPLRASLSDASTSTIADISAAAVAAAVVTSSSSASAAAAAVASTNTTEESDENSAATSGWLSKRGAGVGGARWKRRWFVREGRPTCTIMSADSTPEPINYIDLHQVQAIPVEPMAKERTAFDITTPSRSVSRSAPPPSRTARAGSPPSTACLANHHAAERKRIMEHARHQALARASQGRDAPPHAPRHQQHVSRPHNFARRRLPPKKATMVGEKILPVVPPKAPSASDAAAAAPATAASRRLARRRAAIAA